MTVVITLYLNNKAAIFSNLHFGLYQPDTMTHATTYEHLSERLCLRTSIKTQYFISIFTSTSQDDIRITHTKHHFFLFRIHIIQYRLKSLSEYGCNLGIAHLFIDIIQPQFMQIITLGEKWR